MARITQKTSTQTIRKSSKGDDHRRHKDGETRNEEEK